MNENLINFCKKGIIVGTFLYIGLEVGNAIERRVILNKWHKIEKLTLDIQEELLKESSKPKKRRLFRK